MVMFTVNAMIHSLGAQDEAVILHENLLTKVKTF